MSVKKIFLFLLVICLISILGYNSILAEITTVPQEKKELQQLAEKFIANYYDGLINNNYQKCDFVIDNDNAYLWKGFVESSIQANKILHQGMHSCNYNVESITINIDGGNAIADIRINLKYIYNKMYNKDPKTLPLGGIVPFEFTFEMVNDQWKISNTDMSDDLLKGFKLSVKKCLEMTFSSENDSIAYRQAIDAAVQKRINGAQHFEQIQKDERIKAKAEREKNKMINSDSSTNQNETELVPKGSYSYLRARAIAYANRFVSKPNSYFLYCRNSAGGGEDCTNFVSQCIWAGYKIYITEMPQADLNTLAANKNRMTDTWYANGNTATNQWCGVEYLCDYLTATKTYGPNANLENDGGVYKNIRPSNIALGNILQFRYNEETGNYRHSVIVVFYAEPVEDYDDVRVAQHSDDAYRLVSDLIYTFSYGSPGTFPCDMRILRLKKGNFAS